MLEYMLVQNFQGHDKLRVDFDPHITSIIGPTDAGKSAIIRALRWVATNNPSGAAFIRWGTKGTTVQLFVDGHRVVRKRSRSGDTNTYHLDDKSLKSFGQGVPDRVAALVNMPAICWQQQHDSAYWFSETAGEVSRQLNAIVNLGVIDDTLAGVAQAVHRARTRLDMAEEARTQAHTTVQDLVWVPEFDQAVTVLEDAERAANNAANTARQAAALVQAACTHALRYDRWQGAATAGRAAVDAGTAAIRVAKRRLALVCLLEEMRKCTDAAKVHVPDLAQAEEALKAYKAAHARKTDLLYAIHDFKTRNDALCQARNKAKVAEAAIPKQCPTCGQSL